MPGVRLDRIILALTAVLLLLTAAPGHVRAEPMTEDEINAAVPMPDTSLVPPPTAADLEQPASGSEATATISEPAAAQPATTPPADAQAAIPTTPQHAAADAAVAEKLRDLATGKFDRLVGGKKERAMIDAFYSGRNHAPLWLTDGQPNARAKAAIAYLGGVEAEGLYPADYPTPDFSASSDPAALAEAELQLTASVLAFARHAQIGRVHWSRVSADIFYNQTAPEAADVLADMVDAKDVGEALAAYNPPHEGYRALKAKLAELRAQKGDAPKARIAGGPALKIGMSDARVPHLRDRLGVAGDGLTYDKTLAEGVKAFQRKNGISATGTLTSATIDALNGRSPDRAIDTVIANMERWRWLPRDLGETYVMVNIPDFSLRVASDGKTVWSTRIVTGKPNMATPIMSADMKFITVNPTWNVPPSIVNNEYIPALRQDPTVLERMGLKVVQNHDGTIHIYQPPGERNALGRLRFNFPNKFLVYQHDTPDKHLFAHDKRAYSHGCMRVQDPVRYAEVLLSIVRPGEGYTQDRIRKMFGKSEVDIQFPTRVPVHLTYQTAFVDGAGKLQFRDDVYGRDSRVLAVLKGDERKVADTAIERRENAVRRQVLALPDQTPWYPRNWGGPGPGADVQNFFSRLFGSPFAAPEPPPIRRKPVAQQRRYEVR
jgi:murein L,D-transpeptidase YcbB/YkuD